MRSQTTIFIDAVNVARHAAGQIGCNLMLTFRAAHDYVISANVTQSRFEQAAINANSGGSPFSLLGNNTGFNIGKTIARRRDPSTSARSRKPGPAAILAVTEKYNIDDAFDEVLVS